MDGRSPTIGVDGVAGRLPRLIQTWIDILGTLFFMLPMTDFLVWLSLPVFVNAWVSGEISGSAGGLVRWPVRLLVPLGFFLLFAQGISELIKRIAYLRGLIEDPVEKHKDPGLDIVLHVEKQAQK